MPPLFAFSPTVCAVPLLFALAVLFYLIHELRREQVPSEPKPPDPDGMPENWPANWPRPKRKPDPPDAAPTGPAPPT